VLAIIGIVVGATWFVATSVARNRVLGRDVVTRALVDTGASRRLYADVLSDDALRDAFAAQLGELADLGVDPDDTTAVASAALRLALPPAVVEDVTDTLASSILAYLRGDRERLEAPLPLLRTLDAVDPTMARTARDAIRALAVLLVADRADLESFGDTLASSLAEGQIPADVPVLGGRHVSEAQLLALLDGPPAAVLPPALRADVRAAFQTSEGRTELVSTALDAMASTLQRVVAQLDAGGDITVDLIGVVSMLTGNDRDALARDLQPVREVASLTRPWSSGAGAVLAAAGTLGLVAVWRRRWRVATLAVGVALLGAGGAVWITAAAATHTLDAALAASTRGTGTGVPGAVARLIGELQRHVQADVTAASTRWALGLAAAGVVAVVAGAAARRAGAVSTRRRHRVRVVLVSGLASVPWVVVAEPIAVHAGRACNGHVELCDRRYDEVVQAASHNSMSSPDVVRVWPEHDGGIREQLEHGVRMLMIDATYWDAIDDAPLRALRQRVPSPPVISLLDAIEERLAAHPGIYLCHNVCALGAIPISTALGEVKDFLDRHPDDIVTLMLQDSVDPVDTAAAFDAAGLTDLVYDGPADVWPTLGELIDRGQRLVVFSEQHDGPAPWLHSAFNAIQDTPLGARRPADFSCARNRGPADAPLFVLNHWTERTAPDRAHARVVNQRQFIVERARRCADERGRLPNFVAVSFYDIGDVIGAVDELNGLAS
jgi:hypothetical protein